MATATHIPVSEYLATSYRPDRDYIDGEVRERNLSERPHAALQGVLFALFHANRKAWKVTPLLEQRVQVKTERYRVPDVCVLAKSDPITPIVMTAPMICIEILSPADSLPETQLRADDYEEMGVGSVWAFDPIRKCVWTMNTNGLFKVGETELTVPGTPIRIVLADVFVELDEIQSA